MPSNFSIFYLLFPTLQLCHVMNSSLYHTPTYPLSLSLAVDHNYWALILILFPILTLFGNILVILSVCRERSLQTVTNYFIVSLAIADLLVAVVVMPFAVYFLVSNVCWGAGGVAGGAGRCQNQNGKCKIAAHLRLILSSVWGPSNK